MFEFNNKPSNTDLLSPKDGETAVKKDDPLVHSPFIDVERTIAQMKLDAGRIMKVNHPNEPKM